MLTNMMGVIANQSWVIPNGLLNNLLLLYGLDSNVLDSSVNWNDGTAFSMAYNTSDKVLWSASGDFVVSWSYDASLWWQTWAHINTWIPFWSNNISIWVWVKPSSNNDVQIVINNDSGWFDNSLSLGICCEWTSVSTSNTFCAIHQNSSTSSRFVVEDDATISTSSRTHFVYTYDGSTQRLYRDWSEVDSTSRSWLTLNANNITIGRRFWSAIRFYNWLLDQPLVSQAVWTPTQVMQLYNSWSGLAFADFTS